MPTPKLFAKKIAAFNEKLEKINPSGLAINDYSKRYLEHLLDNSLYYLAIYNHVLSNAQSRTSQQVNQLTLVDFGAGNGLLGLFAKFCGYKKVFLCDMDPAFILASKLLAKEMQIPVDDFICGDAGVMRDRLQNESVDIVVGTDVIEHIYDLDHFFGCIKSMNAGMITVVTTASNPDNPIKVRRLKKLQVKDELLGSDPGDFALAGAEKQEAFLEQRKKIISGIFPGMAQADLFTLGKLTRGLAAADIVKAADLFLTKNELPTPLVHPTNTCDPRTGSWTERILSIEEYRNIYGRHDFFLNIENGFYNEHSKLPGKIVKRFLNLGVKLLGKSLAPFISLTGYPNRVDSL